MDILYYLVTEDSSYAQCSRGLYCDYSKRIYICHNSAAQEKCGLFWLDRRNRRIPEWQLKQTSAGLPTPFEMLLSSFSFIRVSPSFGAVDELLFSSPKARETAELSSVWRTWRPSYVQQFPHYPLAVFLHFSVSKSVKSNESATTLPHTTCKYRHLDDTIFCTYPQHH